jgi:hypothetical protein
MDDIVKQALAKWPNVPSCTGWLMLDRRGTWRMRDEAAQAAGAPGAPIRHAALLGFINRNYEADERGRWFFQNGPQRVYVELEYTPWVVRLMWRDDALRLSDQAGEDFTPRACLADDAGAVLFTDERQPARLAALHDHDLDLFTDHARFSDDGQLEAFAWRAHTMLPVRAVERASLPAQFGFVQSPAAAEIPP